MSFGRINYRGLELRYNLLKTIKKYSKFLYLFLFGSIIYFVSKPLFLSIIFIGLDLFNITIKRSFKIYIPIDFIVVGSIILTYIFGIKYGLILSSFLLINRFIMGTIEFRHFVKLIPMITIIILAQMFSQYPLVKIGILLFVLRYFLEYIIEIFIFRTFRIELELHRLIHVFSVYLFLNFFNILFLRYF
jgi:hypothetical protein